MSAKKPRGKIVAKAVVSRAAHPGAMLYIDGQGNVRAAPRQSGSKPGRRTCKRKGEA
jgi:hypothetical protein